MNFQIFPDNTSYILIARMFVALKTCNITVNLTDNYCQLQYRALKYIYDIGKRNIQLDNQQNPLNSLELRSGLKSR